MILINKNLKNKINDIDPLSERVDFFHEESLLKIIKQAEKSKINRIYYTTDSTEELIIKTQGKWVPVSKYHINLLLINEKKLSFGSDVYFPIVKEQNKNDDNDVNYSLAEDAFVFKKDMTLEKIKLLLDEEIYVKYDQFSKYSFAKKKANVTGKNFSKFEKEILDDKFEMPGVPKKKVHKSGEFIFLETKSSNSTIQYSNESFDIITISNQGDFARSSQYTNSINNNVINNANDITNNSTKFTTKNIISSLVGFIIVIFLLYFTFNFIFSAEDLTQAFKILGDKVTWTHIWVYILILNFIITFFYTLFLMVTVSLFSKKKMNWKNRWEMFMSIQLRQVAMFTTGNFVFATVIWGLYLNRRVGIRISALVGTLGVMNILKSMFQLATALIFLTPGTIYLSSMIDNSWTAVWIFVLGWGGLFWSSFHNVVTSLPIFIPFFQIMYIRSKLNITLRKNNSSDELVKVNSEIYFARAGFSRLFESKERIYRILMLTVGMTIFEAVETVVIFQMVEDYYVYSLHEPLLGTTASYWNIFSIAGVRLMSSYVHMFPLLNIIPGQGAGITDLFMSNVNVLVIAKQHGLSSADVHLNFEEISRYSDSATIITRFMNFYLKKIISIFIVIYICIKITIKYLWKKYYNIEKIYN